jgi:winged helix DNA-binding protein
MDIARQRLTRSFLIDRPFSTGRDVVRALGAVQAQDYDGAKWAVSQRTSGLTDDAIERELASGDILRTHVLRPTWHFVDPADIRWMLALTGPYVMKRMAPYDRKLELDEKVFRKSNAALTGALRDGASLTRAELKDVLTRAGVGQLNVPRSGPLGIQRTAHLLMRAELEAIICSGPRRGRQFTYTLLDARVPAMASIERDEALLELTRKYFRGRGPATAQDFGWWSGLPMADVRRGIDLARAGLAPVEIDGTTYWIAGNPLPRPKTSAHLLPNYDEFFIGYRDRSAIGMRLESVKAVTGWSALIPNVIVMDGQLVGGWRRRPAGDAVRLDLDLMTSLSPSEQQRLKNEVRRYEAFAGKPVDLRGLDDRSGSRKRKRR